MGSAASEVANAGAKFSHASDLASRSVVASSEQPQGFLQDLRRAPAEVTGEPFEQALGIGINVDLYRAWHLPIVPKKTSRNSVNYLGEEGDLCC